MQFLLKKLILSFIFNISLFLILIIGIQYSSNKGKVNFLINPNGYLSVSDKKRLTITRKYFSNDKFVLLDRDGVLNCKNEKHRYVRNLDELKINFKFLKYIKKKFKKRKFLCITNQAGVSTGDVKMYNLVKINNKIKKIYNKNNLKILEFFISKHHFMSNHYDRKPNPGLFIKASKKYKFILDRTMYFGDDLRDIEAAYRANCKCIYVGENKIKKLLKIKYKNTLIKI